MIDAKAALKIKTELLCKGLILDRNLETYYNQQGLTYGRKGGAGPLGGRYFILEDHQTLVNVALWDSPEKSNLILNKKKGDFFEVYNKLEDQFYGKFKLVPNPEYYNPKFKTTDGIEMKKIALVHGIDCLASTIYQKCKYWACGEACKFCGIELSLKYNTTIEEKNYQQMNEVIAQAKREGRCNHMTLTSGTEDSVDKGIKRYIELLRGIKAENPELPLHIQIEPIEDLFYINQLKEAGADTIGIHIEILDEEIRKIITPGKANIPYELFEKNWNHALDIFGKNQVSTFILTGFEDPYEDFLLDLEKIVSLGVIPFITPVRSIPGMKDLPTTNYNILMDKYIRAAKMMKEYGVNPLENKAGCVRCGGCSAIKEAYLAV
ncbi:MAG: radical SAM protein [Promethearchaeota archaeon]|nr:MAG: radical SAM protein [Candidatus Lokiarchaeota archaeon]